MTNPKDPQADIREAIGEILKDFEVWAHDYSDEEGQTHTQVQPQKATQTILTLFQAREQKLLTELRSKLEGHLNRTPQPNLDSTYRRDSYNAAINRVLEIIERYREGL